jgi:hypothetical protein
MSVLKKYSPVILTCFLLLTGISGKTQSAGIVVDSSSWLFPQLQEPVFISTTFHLPVFTAREYIIKQEPNEGDTALIKSGKYLLQKGPGYITYEAYANLAAAYWRAGRNNTAKKMFLLIEQSKELYYTGTLFHSAGNRYEYGSYTSNLKNEACQYLCKIYIEEKNYGEALAYLVKADKKYKIQFNCGTGAMSYANNLNSLYVVCYAGLGFTDKLIDLYLHENFYYDDQFIALLKKKYSRAELKRYLQLAVDNITFVKDEWATEVFTQCENEEEDSLTARYTNGSGYTVLFGHKTDLPRPDLKDGETVTRQHFVDAFINSRFYKALLNIKEKEDPDMEESSFKLLNELNSYPVNLTSPAPRQKLMALQ